MHLSELKVFCEVELKTNYRLSNVYLRQLQLYRNFVRWRERKEILGPHKCRDVT